MLTTVKKLGELLSFDRHGSLHVKCNTEKSLFLDQKIGCVTNGLTVKKNLKFKG